MDNLADQTTLEACWLGTFQDEYLADAGQVHALEAILVQPRKRLGGVQGSQAHCWQGRVFPSTAVKTATQQLQTY